MDSFKKLFWNDRQAIMLFLAVLAIGLAASAYLYSGPMPIYDDVYYLNCAHALITGNTTFIENEFCYPFLYIVPIAMSTNLFGNGSLQAVMPSIVEYSLLIFITFAIAYKIYGKYFASAGTLMVASAPFLVGYATRVLSDIAVGLAVAISLSLFLLSISKKDTKLSLLSGFVAAVTIYIKIDAFFYVLLFLAANIIEYRSIFRLRKIEKQKRIWKLKNLLASMAGLSIGIFAYFAVFYFVLLDPFFPLQHFMTSPSTIGPLEELGILFSPIAIHMPRTDIYQMFPLGPIAILAAIGSLSGLWKKDKRINYISFFNWSLFAYMIFGTSSLERYIPVPVVSRFFDMNAMMLGVLGGYALFCIYDMANGSARRRQVLNLLFFAFIILVELSYLPLYSDINYYYYVGTLTETREVYAQVSYIESNPISKNNATEVFVDGTPGIELLGLLFEEFAFKYSKSIDLHSTDYRNSFPSDAPSLICNKSTAENGAYLIVLGNINSSYQTLQQKNYLADWLGKNCTISFVKKIVNGSAQVIVPYIYKIK
ncbi:MAG: ArnT family glycosyltransferase [Candidatus Micrarchaeia archaeon]